MFAKSIFVSTKAKAKQNLITRFSYISDKTLALSKVCGLLILSLLPILWLRSAVFTKITSNKSNAKIKELVSKSKVVLFMKGVPEQPRCGFSNAVVQILRIHGVEYESHDVLLDESMRQGLKEFSNWPTFPQLYINGELVGGCDILLNMHQNGDLIQILEKVGINSALKQIDREEK